MGEKFDRRRFLRLGRGGEDAAPDADPEEAERELTPKELKILELAEFCERYLASFAAEDEELLAGGPLLTKAYDQAYMRVTSGHVAYTTVLGVSAAVRTDDVKTFDTEPPVDVPGYGVQVIGVLRAHHPADPPHITRSYAFRFPEDGLLVGAIRSACKIPEPEPEPDDSDEFDSDEFDGGAASPESEVPAQEASGPGDV